MPDPVDVSVCIANWNCRDLLRNCLTTLLRQRQDAALEVIVVDNGSTDGAPEMVLREFPEVVLVRNPDNRGFSRANNQAARRSQGAYLFFLNNDTVVSPGAIGALLAHARSHPRAGIVAPRLVDAEGRTQASCRPRPTVAAMCFSPAAAGTRVTPSAARTSPCRLGSAATGRCSTSRT
jgi:GT2 family glycosyltransferase